jgi:hypothetical protein
VSSILKHLENLEDAFDMMATMIHSGVARYIDRNDLRAPKQVIEDLIPNLGKGGADDLLEVSHFRVT